MKRTLILTMAAIILFIPCVYAKDQTYTDPQYGFSITYPSEYRSFQNFQGAHFVMLFPKKGITLYPPNVAVTITNNPASGRSLQELVDIYFKYSKSVLWKEEVMYGGTKFFSVIQLQEKTYWFIKLKLKLHHLITIRGTRIYDIVYSAPIEDYDLYQNQAEEIIQTVEFSD